MRQHCVNWIFRAVLPKLIEEDQVLLLFCIILLHFVIFITLLSVPHYPFVFPIHPDFVVDQTQAVKFALDIACGMAFLHTLEPMIPRHYLNSKSVMVRNRNKIPWQSPVVIYIRRASLPYVDQSSLFVWYNSIRNCWSETFPCKFSLWIVGKQQVYLIYMTNKHQSNSLLKSMLRYSNNCILLSWHQIDDDMTARISMADVKFSFQCPGRMYSPAWMAPEGTYFSFTLFPSFFCFPNLDLLNSKCLKGF